MDVTFINPSVGNNYQFLSDKYTTVEPPTWSLLLAQSMRNFGYKVSIIDANAESLSKEKVFKRVKFLNPRIVVFVVYGQNVNAGTANMSEAVVVSKYLKLKNDNLIIAFIGSYVQALPVKALKDEKSIDIIFTNEGVYALKNLLKLKNFNEENFKNIKGIAYRNKREIIMNSPEAVVPHERMDYDLPGYAWELLPFKDKPLDLYRSPMWHGEYENHKRSPYVALQTSLGCHFKCSFCMINIINRNDNEEVGVASNYAGMRFWSTKFIINEFKKLIDFGVQTIRITDEMFLLNPKYYIPLCEKLSELNKNDSLRIWVYSRIDTIKNPEVLKLIRRAGIKWLALGIESADKAVRLEVSKGKFEDVEVKKIIDQVHDADIEVMANYIFGLPGDTEETIKKTYDLSVDLCTLGWNTYPAMALPGSLLYKEALNKKIKMPDSYSGYSFHAYNTVCLPTDSLEAWKILKLRDDAFKAYHSNEKFLNKITKKYGEKAKENILDMLKISLKRKLVDEK